MITLTIPAYTAGENIERTIASAREVCNDVVIISTAIYLDDRAALAKLGSVVELPWNYVFGNGFGALYNQGGSLAKNDWQLLLGVAETVAEQYSDLHKLIRHGMSPGDVCRCNHVNDVNTWKRIWNRQARSQWSGVIHEEIAFAGRDWGVVFRMQDTEKTPHADPLRNEVFKYIKTLSYNYLYKQLLLDPNRLGAASPGWLEFVNGARESIESFCSNHADLLQACIEGESGKFINLVEARMNVGQKATGVDFNPQGT